MRGREIDKRSAGDRKRMETLGRNIKIQGATTTYSGAYGSREFVKQMEEKLGRHWRNPGPRKPAKSETRTEQTPPFSVCEKV
jgi:hypothetical protein